MAKYNQLITLPFKGLMAIPTQFIYAAICTVIAKGKRHQLVTIQHVRLAKDVRQCWKNRRQMVQKYSKYLYSHEILDDELQEAEERRFREKVSAKLRALDHNRIVR